jgi:NADP-dependent 3-hydroxy acid dehydrogenase YdfG
MNTQMTNGSNSGSKHAIVTGASSGMGLGISRALAEAGFAVMLVGRNEERVAQVVQSLKDQGHRVQGSAIDVKDAEAMAETYAAASDENGQLAVAVHAAGTLYPGSIAEGNPNEWADTIGTNLLGVMYGSQQALRRMGSGGCIINVSSVAGRQPSLIAPYCASKYGVTGFTECLRREAAPLGIRVTCFEPGLAWTDFNRNMPSEFQEARREDDALSIEDVAETVMAIVSLPAHVDVGELVVRHVSQTF